MYCAWLVGRLDMRLVGLCQLRKGHTHDVLGALACVTSELLLFQSVASCFDCISTIFFHTNMFRALLLGCGADQLFGLIAHSMRHVSRLDDPDSIVQFCLLHSLTYEVLACLATDRLHILTVHRIPWTVGRV